MLFRSAAAVARFVDPTEVAASRSMPSLPEVKLVANSPTNSPQMAVLQREIEKACQDKRDADLALKAAQNKLERALQTQRDAEANFNEMAKRDQRSLDKSRSAQAHIRFTETFTLVDAAKSELPPVQAAAANAAARLQGLERRKQVFLTIGAQCLDPHTVEETRQCKSDFHKANFGTEQDSKRPWAPHA